MQGCFSHHHHQCFRGLLRFGDVDLTSPCDNFGLVVLPVLTVEVHPSYRRPQAYSDIALLTLPLDGVVFTDYIRPICLPKMPQTDPDSNEKRLVRVVRESHIWYCFAPRSSGHCLGMGIGEEE